MTLLTIPISIETFVLFFNVLSLSIDFVGYTDICVVLLYRMDGDLSLGQVDGVSWLASTDCLKT